MLNSDLFLQAFIMRSRTFICVNTNTRQLYIYKYRGTLTSNPDSPLGLDAFVESALKNNHIYPDDKWQFELLKEIPTIMRYWGNDPTAALIYRRLENGSIGWSRLEFLIPFQYSEEFPYIYLYITDQTGFEASYLNSFTIFMERVIKISKASLSEDTFSVIQEPRPERIVHERIEIRKYSEELEHIGNHLIHPDDVSDFKECLSMAALKRHFAFGNPDYTYYCRRKLSGIYKWVKILCVPSKDWSDSNQIIYFYTVDVDRDISKIIDFQNLKSFARFFGGLYRKNIEVYYENIITPLHILTQSYIDFYLVNLEKDLYIRYKQVSGTMKQYIPFVGSYSQSSIEYIKNYVSSDEMELLSLYCTSAKLREAMRNQIILEFDFHSADGKKLRTICQKIESVNGTPTKILCRTIAVPDSTQLKIRTFGNFDVLHQNGTPIRFERKQSKELLAYLIDRQGYPVTSKDIVTNVLEKPEDDMNAIKYCSTLIRRAMKDLEAAGYPNVIIKEQKTIRINQPAVDCDYYHLLNGDFSYFLQYHNEYMKEYSWAENTNSEIQSMIEK